MAENARPPVAVRIVRPYDTEEAFLESELETVGKTSVILIGAHARPQGVILRFEVTLQNGAVVLRGEGRVLQHKDSAFRGQPGLALRFTRLDPKSKALVDRASAIREARLGGSMPPPLPPSARAGAAVPPPLPSEPLPPPSSVELSSADLEPESEPQQHPTSPPTGRPPAPDDEDDSDESPTAKPPPMPATATSIPPADPTIPPDALAPAPSFAPLATHLPSADEPLASLLTAPTPVPPPPERDRPTSEPPEVEERPASTAIHATTSSPKPTDTAVTRVADRDALLARLRERRAGMSDEKKDEILRSRQ